jgi:hypothetical protein
MKRPEGTRLNREASPRLRTTTTRSDDPDNHCASRCKLCACGDNESGASLKPRVACPRSEQRVSVEMVPFGPFRPYRHAIVAMVFMDKLAGSVAQGLPVRAATLSVAIKVRIERRWLGTHAGQSICWRECG